MTELERDKFREEQLAAGARLLPASIVSISEVFCGCGSPQAAWAWVRDYLKERETGSNAPYPEAGLEWVAIYLMDHLGLTEHGSNIAWCWLTEGGKEALAFLEENGPDWASRGWWIDSEGTTHSDLDAINPGAMDEPCANCGRCDQKLLENDGSLFCAECYALLVPEPSQRKPF